MNAEEETMTMVATMVSWHGDPTLKAKYIARVEAHRIADQLIQGIGWFNGKGCAVGCTFDNYDHARGPIEIGVPEWLMYLEDVIFEGLPQEKAMFWPTQFLSSIPVGANLEPVRWQLAILRHKRQIEGLIDNPEPYAREVEQALHLTISYCEMMLTGPYEKAAESAALSAALSAAESARSAAYSARLARAEYLVTSAAESAALSAADSANSDANSDADSANSAAYSAAGSARSVRSVRSAAYSARLAAESARSVRSVRSVRSAAYSARLAAESAAPGHSPTSAAESAARSAAYSAAYSAALSAHYEWEAETLLLLLRETAITI
jgi:hypothetical protein